MNEKVKRETLGAREDAPEDSGTRKLLALQRLSICACGFPVLDERIGLGTMYSVDVDTVRGGFSYRCGGCGVTLTDVTVVYARSVLCPNAIPRPLPYDIFTALRQA